MLDKFGKLARSLLLYDIAKELDISSAEFSAIECGKKPVPDLRRMFKKYFVYVQKKGLVLM